MTEPLTWIETEPGKLWRSLDGQYAIMAVTLPESPPTTEYHVRKIDPMVASAYPTRGTLGVLLESSPWLWSRENSVHSAEAIANRDAFSSAHDRSIPADHPAVALVPFWWPISNGTSRGALAVSWKDGQLVAQVLGMTRDGDEGFVPAEWTDINLTELGLVPAPGTELATRTDHPRPCRNCGAKVGQEHKERCEVARCLVTGQQRLLCIDFGGSPIAGAEAVYTNSQDEFEEFFKTPTGHDCGRDVWRGAQEASR